ncbi:unnamed protein product [Arctogadus glacialis]
MDGRYADGTNPFTASIELTLAADGGMVHGQTPSLNRALPPTSPPSRLTNPFLTPVEYKAKELEQDAISVEVFTNALADAEVVQKLLEKQPRTLSRAYDIAHSYETTRRAARIIQPGQRSFVNQRARAATAQQSTNVPIRVFIPGALPVTLKRGVVAGILQPATVLGKLEPQPPLAPLASEPINSVSASLPSHLQVLYNESCASLPKGDHERVACLLRSYSDVFSTGPTDLGRTGLVQQDILTIPVPEPSLSNQLQHKGIQCNMAEEDEEDAVKTPAEQPPVGVVVPEDSYGGSPAVESKHLPVGVADVFSDDQAGSLFRPGVYRTTLLPLHPMSYSSGKGSAGKVQHKVGDAVWFLVKGTKRVKDKVRKFLPSYEGPYFIVGVLDDLVYRIKKGPRMKMKVVHHDKLKAYQSRTALDNSWTFREAETWAPVEAPPPLSDPSSSETDISPLNLWGTSPETEDPVVEALPGLFSPPPSRAAASFLATLLSLRWRRLGPRIRPGEKLLILF